MEFIYFFCVASTKGHTDRYLSTARALGSAAIEHQYVVHRDKYTEIHKGETRRCYVPQQIQAWMASQLDF